LHGFQIHWNFFGSALGMQETTNVHSAYTKKTQLIIANY
jgi:hypothetical protein